MTRFFSKIIWDQSGDTIRSIKILIFKLHAPLGMNESEDDPRMTTTCSHSMVGSKYVFVCAFFGGHSIRHSMTNLPKPRRAVANNTLKKGRKLDFYVYVYLHDWLPLFTVTRASILWNNFSSHGVLKNKGRWIFPLTYSTFMVNRGVLHRRSHYSKDLWTRPPFQEQLSRSYGDMKV